MSALLIYFSISIITLLTIWFMKEKYENRNFPPGPPTLPLLGCTPFLETRQGGKNIMQSVKWIPKYGDIMGLKFRGLK